MPFEIDLQVDDAYIDQVMEGSLRAAVQTTLLHERMEAGEVSLVVSSEELLQQLNRSYRAIDAPTDVLSFSARESPEDAPGQFVSAPEAANFLGDVVISLPSAARQAEAAGHSLERELQLLTVHGVLHLLGYDHATAEDEAAMWAIQDEILAALAKET